jgi:hypothetical protein
MIISFFVGCSSNKLGLLDEEYFPASSIALCEADAQLLSDKVPIHLYFANEDFSKLRLEIRYIPASEADNTLNHLAEIIVNELIKGPKIAGLKPVIPTGTTLKSKIKIDGEVATVDFSKEFRDNHPGGIAQEKMTIYSIVNSLTEIKEINQVKFLIDGKSSAEYKGDFRFNKPFPRSTSLISRKTESQGIESQESKEVSPDSKDKKDDSKDSFQNEGVKTGASLQEESEDASTEVSDEYEETMMEFEDGAKETYIDFE